MDAPNPEKTSASKADVSRKDLLDLRLALKDSLQNVGILSAFLCGLAAVIYSQPPLEGRCFGRWALDFVSIIVWMGMGIFFLAIIFSVTLASDIEGVPDCFLIRHLKHNKIAHSSPLILTYAGTMFLATGYGFDLNERIGCPIFPFGTVVAPMFPMVVIGFALYLRHRRSTLCAKFGMEGDKAWSLGSSFLLPWFDLVLEVEERINNSTIGEDLPEETSLHPRLEQVVPGGDI